MEPGVALLCKFILRFSSAEQGQDMTSEYSGLGNMHGVICANATGLEPP